MKCPECSGPMRVTETRDNGEVARTRVCGSCGHRIKTVEIEVAELQRIRTKANAPDARRSRMIEIADQLRDLAN